MKLVIPIILLLALLITCVAGSVLPETSDKVEMGDVQTIVPVCAGVAIVLCGWGLIGILMATKLGSSEEEV